MILISNINLEVQEGSTIASTGIYGDDKRTYANIGSGNVFKLHWKTTGLIDDWVNSYRLVIKRHEPTLDVVYYDIFDQRIGLINDFYVDSSLLPTFPEQYVLSIYVVAYTEKGNIITSNVVAPYVSKAAGTYVKVSSYIDDNGIEKNYTEPIMKRALALAYVPTTAAGETVLTDRDGNVLVAKDDQELTAEYTKLLSSDSWNIMQECFVKNDSGSWQTNDIEWEVLVDETGDIITDNTGDPIYVL